LNTLKIIGVNKTFGNGYSTVLYRRHHIAAKQFIGGQVPIPGSFQGNELPINKKLHCPGR
jgi:hypothetical protein